MTESAEELINIQDAFREIAALKHPLLRVNENTIRHVEVIPLFEKVSTIMDSDLILEKYVALHEKKYNATPIYLRPYVARSDPALNSGIVPTVLAIKVALSRYKDFEHNKGIKLYPIIGSASLPFRGGLTPHTVEQFADEYKGIRTALIQSAFRYDFEEEDVINAIQQLDQLLVSPSVSLSLEEEQRVRTIIPYFEKAYQNTVEELAPIINTIASALPQRRERVQHVGLFGYSRGVGKVRLPRAIGFTGAMYSLGIPPELIGTGRGLHMAGEAGLLDIVEQYYVNLRSDLIRAGHYVNKKIINDLTKKVPACEGIRADIEYIEKYLGRPLGPETLDEQEHRVLTERIYQELQDGALNPETPTRAALLRKSLG
jgi:phosphoenolpyruvate carboxylase